MSSVGFTSNGKDLELEKLREAYDSLKDVVRSIEAAIGGIDAMNVGMAKAHLNAAKWHTEQAKKSIAVVGQAKNQKARRRESFKFPRT